MSDIDAVIARSKQAGEFAERRTFTVERQSAIRKMRMFALANGNFYIVELIQAAIANGAEYIDIKTESGSVLFSYVGGGFSKDELGDLFEFLFAAKDDLDIADIRQLALGINALLKSRPENVVIESGKGTLESTSRIEIRRDDTVHIGRPTEPLDGTFIRASGMNRKLLGTTGRIEEGSVIEERCLTASIPILYNDSPIFGYRSMRTPNLFGYKRVVTFDEGDLYGTIGIATNSHSALFKLLTYGVWVESVRHQGHHDASIGGVICFDRLRKTADRAGVVRDHLYEQLWVRLKPYIEQLISGKSGKLTFDISRLSGERLDARAIREIAADNDVLVVFDKKEASENLGLAAQFGQVLKGEVIVTGAADDHSLDLIAGDLTEIVRPRLESKELEFYGDPPMEALRGPFLTNPIELPPVTFGDLLDEVSVDFEMRFGHKPKVKWIPRSLMIHSTVYALVHDPSPGWMSVDVRSSGRRVWEGKIHTGYPGHTLIIELPHISPTELRTKIDGKTVAQGIAEIVEVRALEFLQQSTQRIISAVEHLKHVRGNVLPRIVLSSINRGLMKTISPSGIGLELIGDLPDAIRDIGIFETLEGSTVSLAGLAQMLNQQSGLIYGVVEGVDPDLKGLDTSKILRLDSNQELELISLFGESSYVRVDSRDTIVRVGSTLLRDIAVGLREYSDDSVLLWEGEKPEERQISSLVHELMSVVTNASEPETIRQAYRHLVWFVIARVFENPGPAYGADHMPLFVMEDGRAVSAKTLHAMPGDAWFMLHGWTTQLDAIHLLKETHSLSAYACLEMSPFVYHVLSKVVSVRPAIEAVMDVEESSSEDFFRVPFELDYLDLKGTIGMPIVPPEFPTCGLVYGESRKVLTLRTVSKELGLTGWLSTPQELSRENFLEIERQLLSVGLTSLRLVFEGLISTPAEWSGNPVVERTFRFAGAHVMFALGAGDQLGVEINSHFARSVLSHRVFPSKFGMWVSGLRLIEAFVSHYQTGDLDGWSTWLADDAPQWQKEWCETVCAPSRVTRLPSQSVTGSSPPLAAPDAQEELELDAWLAARIRAFQSKLGESDFPIKLTDADWSSTRELCRLVGKYPKMTLELNTKHRLVKNALHSKVENAREWLLLSLYAEVNEYLVPITDHHELLLQAEVIDSILG